MKAMFGRRTTRAAVTIAGALALAGAIGSAIAMSPIVQPPIKWAGGVEFGFASTVGSATVYAVPPGRSLILTDLLIGNNSGVLATISILQAPDNCFADTTLRVTNIFVPTGQTTAINLQTGIGFGAERVVCISSNASVSMNGRGFLFTPGPAS